MLLFVPTGGISPWSNASFSNAATCLQNILKRNEEISPVCQNLNGNRNQWWYLARVRRKQKIIELTNRITNKTLMTVKPTNQH